MIAGMPRESSPRPVWRIVVVIVIVLVILAAGFGGWALGRHGQAPAPPAVNYNVSPYWPLASHVYDGNGTPGYGRVTRWVPQGLPYGWPHTEDGAKAAATAVLTVFMTPMVYGDPSLATRMYGASGTDLIVQNTKAWDEVGIGAAQTLQNAINDRSYPQMQGWPLAWKVDSTSTAANAGGGQGAAGMVNAVTMEIWAAQTFVLPGHLSFSQRWFTEKLTIAWGDEAPDNATRAYTVSQDWQIQSATATDGPVPLEVDTNQQATTTPPGELGWTSYGSH